MAFTNLDAFIDSGILQAGVGMPAGDNPYWGQRARILVLAHNALQGLADKVSQDVKRRHLLQKSFSIVLTSGVGPIDATMLSAAIGYGSVVDADSNILSKVDNYNDLVRSQNPFFGYYNMTNNQVYTRQISSGSLTDTATPLTVFCSYVPLATEIPNELQNDATDLLAQMIKMPVSE
jgi:hypothetical protein